MGVLHDIADEVASGLKLESNARRMRAVLPWLLRSFFVSMALFGVVAFDHMGWEGPLIVAAATSLAVAVIGAVLLAASTDI